MNCKLCNSYYRQSQYNTTDNCDACLEETDDWDSEDELDIQQLLNPTGKTPARIEDN